MIEITAAVFVYILSVIGRLVLCAVTAPILVSIFTLAFLLGSVYWAFTGHNLLDDLKQAV